jgi:ribosomal protein S12 methylthiotransferase accessory factor
MNSYPGISKRLTSKKAISERPLFSRKTGILKTVSLLLRGPSEPRLHVAITEITDAFRYSPFSGGISSTGVGLTFGYALNSAIGEAVEGYCSTFIPDGLPFKTWKELNRTGCEALKPADCPLYSDAQYSQKNFPFHKFREDTPIRWVEGTSLLDRGIRLVPASLVYCDYHTIPGENRISYPNFTGVACGPSKDAAILSAIYETVERDAMMIWWLNQLPMPKCDLDSGFWFSSVFNDRFASTGLEYELWEITSDLGIPTFFALLTDLEEQIFSGGCAAHLDPEVAALKSLFECVQNRLGALALKRGVGSKILNSKAKKTVLQPPKAPNSSNFIGTSDFCNLTHINQNLEIYTDPAMSSYLEHIRTTPSEVSLNRNGKINDVEGDLPHCLEILNKNDLDVILVDLTLPEIVDEELCVVRVLIPGLVPNSVTAWPYLGCQRLYDVPERMGFFRKEEANLEKAPIPYG